jgi:hypothetical protein
MSRCSRICFSLFSAADEMTQCIVAEFATDCYSCIEETAASISRLIRPESNPADMRLLMCTAGAFTASEHHGHCRRSIQNENEDLNSSALVDLLYETAILRACSLIYTARGTVIRYVRSTSTIRVIQPVENKHLLQF